MTPPIRPEPDSALIRRIAALRKVGATDAEIAQLIDEHDAGSTAPSSARGNIDLGGGALPGFAAESTAMTGRTPAEARADTRSLAERAAAAVHGASQGITFGFGDEILGALDPFHTTEDYRARGSALRERNPTTALVADLAGGAATGIGGAKLIDAGATTASALAKRALGQRVLASAGAGAAGGAAAGAGTAAGGVGNRVKGALGGALGGVLVGAGVPLVGSLIQTAYRSLFAPTGERAVQVAEEKLAQAIARDQTTPGALAFDVLGDAAQGKPVTIMDRGGENVRGLARAAQSTPGPAKQTIAEFLDTRGAGQGARVGDDLERSLGLAREDAEEVLERLRATQRANARPAYEKAYAHGAVDDPRIKEILQDPAFKQAYRRALRIAKREGVTLPPPETPTVQLLDYVKQGIDDVIDAGFRSGKLGKKEAASIKTLRTELLDILDAKVPDYKAARAIYAGDAEVQNALEAGRDFLTERGSRSAKQIAAMTPSEQAHFRIGALDAIRQRMDETGDGRDLIKVIFGSPEKRAKLRALFDTDAEFKALERDLRTEAQMFDTRTKVTVGSRTAPLLAEMSDLADPTLVQAAADAATGHPVRAAARAVGAVVKRRTSGLSDAVGTELAKRLTAAPSIDQRQFLQYLSALARGNQRAVGALRGEVGTAGALGEQAGFLPSRFGSGTLASGEPVDAETAERLVAAVEEARRVGAPLPRTITPHVADAIAATVESEAYRGIGDGVSSLRAREPRRVGADPGALTRDLKRGLLTQAIAAARRPGGE